MHGNCHLIAHFDSRQIHQGSVKNNPLRIPDPANGLGHAVILCFTWRTGKRKSRCDQTCRWPDSNRHGPLKAQRILSPLRLPFRHIGVRANLTHGPGQTKRFSLYDQLPQRSRNFFGVRQLTDPNKIQREEILMGKLDGKKVAILVTDGFEQVEMTKPREALEEAGTETKIVSPKSGQIQGMNHADKGDKFDVDIPLDEARPEEFDALMIPGGLMNPDELRATPDALEFTKHFFREGKPVAAICHAPWVLIDAGVVRGRKLTSWEHIQTDVKNAGGNWINEDVVVDNGLVTSRKPDDIRAFNKKMIEEFCEGKHARQTRFAGAGLET
jgi:protease I